MTFLSHPTLLLFLILALYTFGSALSQRFKWVIFNPIIFSSTLLILYLIILDISYEQFAQAGKYIDFFLKPSIVALALPLYINWPIIKKQLAPILISQFIGCLVGIISVIVLAKLTGADREIMLSLIPKSVSTAIALEISQTIHGTPSITAIGVMITGIFGSMISFKFLHFSKIYNPISQGIAIGTSSHAMGTLKAMEISNKYGAFASIGMIINGIFTALLAPVLLHFL